MINNEKREKYAAYLIFEILQIDYNEIYDNLVFMIEKRKLERRSVHRRIRIYLYISSKYKEK